MKKNEVAVGKKYIAKISDRLTTVRLVRDNPFGGWDAVNEKTGREVRIRSAAKLRKEVLPKEPVKPSPRFVVQLTEGMEFSAAVKCIAAALPEDRAKVFTDECTAANHEKEGITYPSMMLFARMLGVVFDSPAPKPVPNSAEV